MFQAFFSSTQTAGLGSDRCKLKAGG